MLPNSCSSQYHGRLAAQIKVYKSLLLSITDFKGILLANYPKLRDARGLELLRCIPNSRSLELIYATVARLTRLLKAVIRSGCMFIKPIQRDLRLKPGLSIAESAEAEVLVSITIHDTSVWY